ncbi:MAG: TRAP transporter small permease [Proteobacteria bacterium]|nr:TRAP transporter small permease [Pseudomonadota bacterium]
MTKPPASLAALLSGIRRTEVFITTAAFVVLIVVIFADVVVRRVSGSGLIWAREVGVYANIILTMVGIGVASASGAHLRPRFVDRWFPDSWDYALTRIQEAITAFAFGVLTYLAMKVLLETIQLGDTSTVLRIAVWPIQLCLPLAFGLGALRHGLYAWVPALRPAERSEADIDPVLDDATLAVSGPASGSVAAGLSGTNTRSKP